MKNSSPLINNEIEKRNVKIFRSSTPSFNLLLLAIAFLLSSCIRDIEIELPDHDPILVVNCTFSPDSLFESHISVSAPVLDPNGPQNLETAKVYIFKNDSLVDSMASLGLGFYMGTSSPQYGANYKIRVSAAGYTTAEGTNSIPLVVPISAATYRDSARADEFGYYVDEVRFTINDQPGISNYYQVALVRLSYFILGVDTLKYLEPLYIYTRDPALNKGVEFENSILFTDDLFPGENKELKIELFRENDADSSQKYLILGTLSEDYYKYSSGLANFILNEFNPFAEPVLVHDNIENGFGIFAGFASDSMRVK